MTQGLLQLRCACGWETTGRADDVVVETQEHARRIHNMTSTRDEVLARTVPVEWPADRTDRGSAGGRSAGG